MTKKGIVLAGGTGTRLHPITLGVSKQLLPIYDKPLVYYPISTLMLAGIRDILLISTPEDLPSYQTLLGNGEKFGIRLQYVAQPKPEGLAQAFILGEEFIGDDNVALVLGDNVFYGYDFSRKLRIAASHDFGATVFGYFISNPERFGVIEMDSNNQVISIEEKPEHPKSNYAMTGLYFVDNRAIQFAKETKPSKRGELEITDVINRYLDENKLRVERLGRGFAWLDTGTHESMLDAGQFVQTLETRQGLKIACLEEIAYHNGWLTCDQLIAAGEALAKTQYGQYLIKTAKRPRFL